MDAHMGDGALFHAIRETDCRAGIVLGVSGGLDSMVLLDLVAARVRGLSRATALPVGGSSAVKANGVGPSPRVRVAHVNYRLRPAADDDEAFVRARAEQQGLPCDVLHAESPPSDCNLQAWARQLRYDFFRRLAVTHRCAHVAVAHHADDQAETVLWRVLRGTGLDGLAGMAAARSLGDGVTLLRPLLEFPRAALAAHARRRALRWRDDATNVTAEYTRNRLRHELLPACEALQPGATAHLAGLARRLHADRDWLTHLTHEAWERLEKLVTPDAVEWPRSAFLPLHPALQLRLLRHVYHLLMGDAPQLTEDHQVTVMALIHKGSGTYGLPGAGTFACRGGVCRMCRV